MNRDSLYEADDDDDDDNIGEDLEDIRRAFMVSESNSDEVTAKPDSLGADGGGGGGMPSDSENDDDFEMLRKIKSQLGSSNDVDLSGGAPMGLSLPSDSESEDDDFEMLRSIKSQLALSMDASVPPVSLSEEDEEDDDVFETLRAIRRRFSAYENFDSEGTFMNDSPGKKKQVLASDNEPSSEILSRSNTCESFPDHGKSVVTVPNSEEVQDGHYSVDVHENTTIEPIDQVETCQSSLMASASSSFPEAAHAFIDALRRNRSYQKFLRKKLAEIEATIEKNEKHKRNVKIVKDFQATCKRITKQALSQKKDPRVELISTRKSVPCDSSEGNDKKTSPLTLGPPENPCVANYRMALEKYPVSVDRRNWSTEENEKLAKGVKQQVQGILLKEAIEQSIDMEGSIDTISEITPEMIRELLWNVNWDQLDIKDRSAAECEARWTSTEDPLINHGPWTAAEDENLRSLIQEKGLTDWFGIAESLKTYRTAFQCLARYQRSWNTGILRKEWTAEEDDQLRAAVDLVGEKDWQTVADVLEGRVGTQCSTRWKKSLQAIKKGKWSSEEDKRLKVAMTLFGTKNWKKIAPFVPGRTQTKVRERWVNCLDPKVKRGKWTAEEDAKLREAVKEHGYRWVNVALHVHGRTDNQCWRRWKSLYPQQARLVQEAARLRKESMVGNFVDRESERPALVAGDFLALPEISLEPESEVVPVKKKRKVRQKKADAECESEVSCVATERQPKRRRKSLKGCSGDLCSQENDSVCENEENNEGEVQENVKEKKQSRRRKSVAETSNNCSQVKIGIKKLKPRRKVSAVVPIENQDASN